MRRRGIWRWLVTIKRLTTLCISRNITWVEKGNANEEDCMKWKKMEWREGERRVRKKKEKEVRVRKGEEGQGEWRDGRGRDCSLTPSLSSSSPPPSHHRQLPLRRELKGRGRPPPVNKPDPAHVTTPNRWHNGWVLWRVVVTLGITSSSLQTRLDETQALIIRSSHPTHTLSFYFHN